MASQSQKRDEVVVKTISKKKGVEKKGFRWDKDDKLDNLIKSIKLTCSFDELDELEYVFAFEIKGSFFELKYEQLKSGFVCISSFDELQESQNIENLMPLKAQTERQ